MAWSFRFWLLLCLSTESCWADVSLANQIATEKPKDAFPVLTQTHLEGIDYVHIAAYTTYFALVIAAIIMAFHRRHEKRMLSADLAKKMTATTSAEEIQRVQEEATQKGLQQGLGYLDDIAADESKARGGFAGYAWYVYYKVRLGLLEGVINGAAVICIKYFVDLTGDLSPVMSYFLIVELLGGIMSFFLGHILKGSYFGNFGWISALLFKRLLVQCVDMVVGTLLFVSLVRLIAGHSVDTGENFGITGLLIVMKMLYTIPLGLGYHMVHAPDLLKTFILIAIAGSALYVLIEFGVPEYPTQGNDPKFIGLFDIPKEVSWTVAAVLIVLYTCSLVGLYKTHGVQVRSERQSNRRKAVLRHKVKSMMIPRRGMIFNPSTFKHVHGKPVDSH